jgi:hypothetical protein
MRAFARVFLVLGLLTACQSNPISIPVPNAQFPLASIPTAGRVIMFAQPLTFDRPPISAQYLLEGQATYQQTNLSLEIYGSAFQPGGASCQTVGSYIICDPAGGIVTKLSTAPINFSSGATQPFELRGVVLNQAINQGQIWLGVQIGANQLSTGNVDLRQMLVKVAVF